MGECLSVDRNTEWKEVGKDQAWMQEKLGEKFRSAERYRFMHYIHTHPLIAVFEVRLEDGDVVTVEREGIAKTKLGLHSLFIRLNMGLFTSKAEKKEVKEEEVKWRAMETAPKALLEKLSKNKKGPKRYRYLYDIEVFPPIEVYEVELENGETIEVELK